MRSIVVALIGLGLIALAACGGGNNAIKCSLKNPASIDEGVGQWPKFRRDRQNTGTILLEPAGYQVVARERANPVDTPAEGGSPAPTPTSTPRAFPGLEEGESSVGPFVSSPVVRAIDTANPARQHIYIGSTNGVFYGLDEHLDRLVAAPTSDITPTPTPFPFEVDSIPFPFASTALIGARDEKEVVFVAGGDRRIFGVDQDTVPLKDVWPNVADNSILASVTMGVDGTIYTNSLGTGFISACPNGVLRFLPLATGASESSPAMGFDPDEDMNGTLYFGSDDRRLRAVSKTGILQWSVSLSAPILTAPVVQLDSTAASTGFPSDTESTVTTEAIYVVDAEGTFIKVDRNGRRLCNLETPANIENPVISSPALARFLPAGYCPVADEPTSCAVAGSDGRCDRIYAVFDSELWAINAATGRKVWQLDLGARIQTSPAVALEHDAAVSPGQVAVGTAPIVIVGDDAGKLHFIRDDGDTNTALGDFTLPEVTAERRAILSSPAIAADGTVYVGGQDGRVYAIQ